MPKLIFARPKYSTDGKEHSIFRNNQFIGIVTSGQMLSIEVQAGQHIAESKSKYFDLAVLELNLEVDQEYLYVVEKYRGLNGLSVFLLIILLISFILILAEPENPAIYFLQISIAITVMIITYYNYFRKKYGVLYFKLIKQNPINQ
jgi:hypothetical protein